MLIGCDQLINDFKKLANNERLSHAYLFFGEPQVGKFLFAQCLVNFLENKIFGVPTSFLNETLFIVPDEKGIIGIDAVRSLKHFLYQKPLASKRRTAIIRDAENLTSEAQNAVLKILEEPPFSSLIIFIANDCENLAPPVLSRLQRIYFNRMASAQIEKFLTEEHGLSREEAKKTAAESFGRPGRAIDLLGNKNFENIKNLVKKFQRLNTLKERRYFIKENFINKEEQFDDYLIDKFFEFLIIELRRGCFKNIQALREVLKRLTLIKQFNVNKKLQLSVLY